MKNIKLFFYLIWLNIKIFAGKISVSRIIRYFGRDKVDLIILGLTIMFAVLYFIKGPAFKSGNFSEANYSAWLAVLSLFIVGSCIWTKGIMTDMMRKYIKDPDIRKRLNLDPVDLSTLSKIFGIFFFVCIIVMFVLIFFYFLNF